MTTGFYQNIKGVIDMQVNDFIKSLSVKYGISSDALREEWEGVITNVNTKPSVSSIKSQPIEPKAPSIKSQPIEPKAPSTKSQPIEPKAPSTKSQRVCQYVMLRGSKKGTLCGCEIKNEHDYCTKHLKSVNKTKISKSVDIPEPIDMQKSKVLRRNKSIDKLWHEETGMVFKSIDERVVTHRMVDGDVKDLSEQDIEICKEMGFMYEIQQDNIIPDNQPKDTIGEVEEMLKLLQVGNDDGVNDDEMSDLSEEQ